MKFAIINIQRNKKCTLKDMAGGFGTTFDIGNSPGARLLEFAKKHIANVPDISMAYLAAVLKKAGHDVSFFYNDFRPGFDIYLIQSSIVECKNEKAAAEEILGDDLGRVGFWGRFATEVPEYYRDSSHFILQGEPEAFQWNNPHIDSLSGNVGAGNVVELDSLPFPSWDSFPLHLYRYRIIRSQGVSLPILSSRGCPLHCHYCPYKVNNPFRVRNVDSVVEEIEYLHREYNAGGLIFRDPDFTFSPKRVRSLLTRIIEKKLDGISYYIEGRTDLVDRETVELMAAAGIKGWEIGIETMSHETLLGHGRIPPEIERQEEIIRWCRRSGIRIVGNYMMGFPEDSETSIFSVIDLAKKMNTFAVQFTVCTPYPGTLFFETVKDRLLTTRWEEFTGWNNVYMHPALSSGRIAELREYAYIKYHFRIRYIISLMKICLRGFLEWCGNIFKR